MEARTTEADAPVMPDLEEDRTDEARPRDVCVFPVTPLIWNT